jgi:hypothetical protein
MDRYFPGETLFALLEFEIKNFGKTHAEINKGSNRLLGG